MQSTMPSRLAPSLLRAVHAATRCETTFANMLVSVQRAFTPSANASATSRHRPPAPSCMFIHTKFQFEPQAPSCTLRSLYRFTESIRLSCSTHKTTQYLQKKHTKDRYYMVHMHGVIT